MTKEPAPGIVRMFQDSIGLPSKKSVALHPHLYSGLYNRASEIKALDKILRDLKSALQESKTQNYISLPPILGAIKDTLNGKPHLSWWNLFTLSVGNALSSSEGDDERNSEENRYLNQISEILTEIIRNYRSPNSKLLLEIRLAALEVESRVVELDKIPEHVGDTDETLDYLATEIRLLTKELDRLKNNTTHDWNNDNVSFFHYVSKANQLLRILPTISQSNPQTYQKVIELSQFKSLQNGIVFLLGGYHPKVDAEFNAFWQSPQLDALFELFHHLSKSILAVRSTDLFTFLSHAEALFLQDFNLNKVRPKIFSSYELKHYVNSYNDEFTKKTIHLRAVIKGVKEDRSIKHHLIEHFKARFMEENDLHHIAAKVRFKSSEFDNNPQFKHPTTIQQEILNRMIQMANLSQPKELDTVLKSFTDDEKENRYFLTQEVILEQFIRWRKQGIY